DVRWATGTFSWPSATDVARGSCSAPMSGGAIGAKRTCTVPGLQRSTSYGFQLVAFRGTLNVNAVFGAISNLPSGTTAAVAAPVASVAVTPASASLAIGATSQLSVTLKDASGNTLSGRTVAWSSSSSAVSTVSAGGRSEEHTSELQSRGH